MGDAEGQVMPSVEVVGRLVGELLGSKWPTTEDERAVWFERHGILAQDAQLLREEHGSQSWHSGNPGAPWPAVGWHVFEGDFVGINWFLWHGLPEGIVPGLAEDLRARFVDIAGEPIDQTRREGDDYRFTAYWQTGGRSIEMYLHGGPVLEGRHYEQPVVQLHVNHVELSRRADQNAARAQPVGRGRGGPMDAAEIHPPRQ